MPSHGMMYMQQGPHHRDTARDLARPYTDEVVMHRHGLYWHGTDGVGRLTMFFRPTGVTYDDRPQTIDIIRRKHTVANTTFRFSLEMRKHGRGSGGLEIFAHEVKMREAPTDRLNLLLNTTWDVVKTGEDIGSIGWVPREMNGYYRRLLADHNYAFTHYAVTPFVDQRTPSIFLCLSVWGVDAGLVESMPDIAEDYDLVSSRTNISRWGGGKMVKAWVIPAGYGGEIITT